MKSEGALLRVLFLCNSRKTIKINGCNFPANSHYALKSVFVFKGKSAVPANERKTKNRLNKTRIKLFHKSAVNIRSQRSFLKKKIWCAFLQMASTWESKDSLSSMLYLYLWTSSMAWSLMRREGVTDGCLRKSINISLVLIHIKDEEQLHLKKTLRACFWSSRIVPPLSLDNKVSVSSSSSCSVTDAFPHMGLFVLPRWRSHTIFVQTDHKKTTYQPQHKPWKYSANWMWDGVYCLPLLTSRGFSNLPAFVMQHSSQTRQNMCNYLNNWDHVERDRAQAGFDCGVESSCCAYLAEWQWCKAVKTTSMAPT